MWVPATRLPVVLDAFYQEVDVLITDQSGKLDRCTSIQVQFEFPSTTGSPATTSSTARALSECTCQELGAIGHPVQKARISRVNANGVKALEDVLACPWLIGIERQLYSPCHPSLRSASTIGRLLAGNVTSSAEPSSTHR